MNVFYFKQGFLSSALIFLIILNTSCSQKKEPTFNSYISNKYYVSPLGDDKNSGAIETPLKTLFAGLKKLNAGDTLCIKAGKYLLSNPLRISLIGNQNQWITIQAEEGIKVIIDGAGANIPSGGNYPHNTGLIQIENAAYIRLLNINVQNSHRSGINIQDSHHIDVINCTAENSLSPGIAAWQQCEYIRVLGNTVINANDKNMSWEPFTGSEAPHEAISMAGPHYFEVAWNHVYNCKKEGIDVKETAAFGKVHHNYVHDCARQGLYIDSWFGLLENIEMYQNVVFNCEAGIAVSSEEGPAAQNLKIHHNLVYNNRATGIFFSRWGADNFRKNVQIYNNTFYKNGWGANFSKDPKYWLSGGCYLFTTNLKNVVITNNIFAQNFPFEIGFSSEYGTKIPEEQNIIISYNLIQDINTWEWPFYMETWAKDSVFPTTGLNSILADPLFENPGHGDFRLKLTSHAIQAGNPILEYAGKNGAPDDLGAFPSTTLPEHFWWLTNFPPKIEPDTL